MKAWTTACTGLYCEGLKVGFFNSVFITIPSVIVSIAVGSVTGYGAGELALQGLGVLLHHPARRLVHPLPGDDLSAGDPDLEARHLQHALRRDHGPHDLRHADPDAALPQLLRLAAARAVQGGARRRRRVLGHLLPDHDADVAADLQRRHHPAGHRHLERLPVRPGLCRASATTR